MDICHSKASSWYSRHTHTHPLSYAVTRQTSSVGGVEN
jgi:hypothetical protein